MWYTPATVRDAGDGLTGGARDARHDFGKERAVGTPELTGGVVNGRHHRNPAARD